MSDFNSKVDNSGVDAIRVESDVAFIGFALSDCTVELDAQCAKYLRPVNRTALELATHNRFGSEIGGFWLMADQIAQLRKLPSYYPSKEASYVARTVEAYLQAQLQQFYSRDALGR
jgi:hypothetical protein